MEKCFTSEVIDWFSLSARMDNDEAFIKETMDRWFIDHSETIKSLILAIESKNADDLLLFSHKIKGSAVIFGMHSLSEAAGMLEDSCSELNFEKIPALFSNLKDEFDKALAFISQPNWIQIIKQQCVQNKKFVLMKD